MIRWNGPLWPKIINNVECINCLAKLMGTIRYVLSAESIFARSECEVYISIQMQNEKYQHKMSDFAQGPADLLCQRSSWPRPGANRNTGSLTLWKLNSGNFRPTNGYMQKHKMSDIAQQVKLTDAYIETIKLWNPTSISCKFEKNKDPKTEGKPDILTWTWEMKGKSARQ